MASGCQLSAVAFFAHNSSLQQAECQRGAKPGQTSPRWTGTCPQWLLFTLTTWGSREDVTLQPSPGGTTRAREGREQAGGRVGKALVLLLAASFPSDTEAGVGVGCVGLNCHYPK